MNKSLLFGLLIILGTSCWRISEKEQRALKSLEKSYSEYEFDCFDIYLKVNIGSDPVDTVALKEVYSISILAKDSLGIATNEYRSDLGWRYLNVYSDKRFLFQVSKDIYGSNEFQYLNAEYY